MYSPMQFCVPAFAVDCDVYYPVLNTTVPLIPVSP
jgi:hypothetical protein